MSTVHITNFVDRSNLQHISIKSVLLIERKTAQIVNLYQLSPYYPFGRRLKYLPMEEVSILLKGS